MKFTSTFATAIVLSAMLASAAPVRRQTPTLSSSFTTGAIYFLSNEPSGNNIITATIGSNGMLTVSNVVATIGNGDHGLTGGELGPDPLFSQGVISVSPMAGLLATANPGSNSISLFSIDPTDPSTLTAVGPPIASGGEFPVSVAFNSDGTALCTLNGGAMDGVQCYNVNATSGLSVMAGTRRFLNMGQTTPPSGPFGTASQIVWSQDQTQVYAAVKGNPGSGPAGYIAAWNMTDSGLSDQFVNVTLPAGAGAPFSLTPIPGQNAMFSADAAIGVDVFDFANGPESVAASPRTQSYNISGSMAPCWSAYSPMTGDYYVSDLLTSILTEVSLDANNNLRPSMVMQYPILQNVATLDLEVATVGSQDFLYLLMPNVTAVEVLQLNGPGNATSIQQMDIAGPAASLSLPVNPNFLVGMASYVKPQTRA
ncbi:hypothetical protein K488DRAFT_80018 [Vararia minispora EC-137]|uniref:Uncharacterized protein n=1 Tax=Vararia minispora EC-137 TaxID=1314806 RepID=A0ACB8QD26_9AGAM|nr:hypothetical protein K488DRAFT_80018 [Vararia minispora EC-137]